MVNLDFRTKVWTVANIQEFTRISGSYPFNPDKPDSTDYVNADLGIGIDHTLYIGLPSSYGANEKIDQLYKVRSYITHQLRILTRWLAEYEKQELYRKNGELAVVKTPEPPSESIVAQMLAEGWNGEVWD